MNEHHLAAHLLVALLSAQTRGRASTLDTLAAKVRVRRADLRASVSKLHQRGLLDVRTMRLTMAGFVAATALRQRKLPALRTSHGALSHAA